MKVAVCGLAKQELETYLRAQYRHDIQLVKQKPDFVFCYGGDGTLLFAEQRYPTIPKVMIRHSRVCNLCARLTRETVVRLMVRGQYSVVEQPLLETTHRRKTLYGMNDIMVMHGQPNTGLRYHLWLNGEPWGNELLGDGLVVATPLGSTGYYQSITRSTFQQGLGIAFNNSIFSIGNIVVPEDTSVKVRVDRGPGLVAADNNNHFLPLQTRDTVTIRRSHRSTYVVSFAGQPYRRFNVGIGDNRVPLGFCQICDKPMPQ